MSVVAAGMWCVAGGWSLRRIGDPVVAASAGVPLRTRIGARAEEAEALTAMGELLGSVYRGELVGRIGLGRWDRSGIEPVMPAGGMSRQVWPPR